VADGTGTTAKDRTPPKIVLSRPREGDRFAIGARVRAAYRSRDRRLRVCIGTAPSGELINTAAGAHRFRVHARDKAGNVANVAVGYRAGQASAVAPQIVMTSPHRRCHVPCGEPQPYAISVHQRGHARGRRKGGRAPVNGRPGTHPFTVNATGTDGTPAQKTVTYIVKTPPAPALEVSADRGAGSYKEPISVTYACSGGTRPCRARARWRARRSLPASGSAAVPTRSSSTPRTRWEGPRRTCSPTTSVRRRAQSNERRTEVPDQLQRHVQGLAVRGRRPRRADHASRRSCRVAAQRRGDRQAARPDRPACRRRQRAHPRGTAGRPRSSGSKSSPTQPSAPTRSTSPGSNA
jgi:hypothetical protein